MDIKGTIKDVALGKVQSWRTDLASYEFCQLELEYAYKKSGNRQNSITTETVKIVHEKNNAYDPNALAVYAFNVKVGYIYISHQDEYKSLKKVQSESLRFYYFNNAYRAELIVNYRNR